MVQIALQKALKRPVVLPGGAIDPTGGDIPAGTLRQVATRSGYVPETLNASLTKANHKSVHMFRSAVSSFRVDFSNYFVDTGTLIGDGNEKGPGATMTVTGTVFNPANGAVLATIRFAGATSGTVLDGGTLLSDPIVLAVSKDAAVGIAWHEECSGGICFGVRSSSPGDGFEYGTVLADKTSAPDTIANPSPGIGKLPHAIVALSSAPAIAILGDSRARGVSDTGDATGDQGNVARSIGPTIAYTNAGVPSDRGSNFNASHTNRAKLIGWSTAIIWEYGINTIIGGAGGGYDVVAHAETARALFPDKDFYVCTIEPYTPSSSDNYTTVAGQTASAFNPDVVLANTQIRAGFVWASGIFDIAASIESTQDSGKWKADGVTANLYTSDGLHGNAYANLAIKNDGRIDPNIFGGV